MDLRNWASPVEDQLDLGSCTSNAFVGAYELITIMKKPENYKKDLSRLFVYYNSRKLEGTIQDDTGASVRDTLKAVKKDGVCSEELWPYNIDEFNTEPPIDCYNDAKKRNIKNYSRITTIENMLDALNNNNPIVFGTIIYESFEFLNYQNPVLTMPTAPKWQNIGAHSMVMVGYCWISFDYIKSEAWDLWVFDIDLNDAPT